jgi:hypothetical protein
MVAALLDADVPGLPPDERARAEAFVVGQVRSLPAHLRAGVGLAGVVAGALGRRRATSDLSLAARIGPVRDYVRLLRSLTLFAVYEP